VCTFLHVLVCCKHTFHTHTQQLQTLGNDKERFLL
jgi:hypothetical protein